MSRAAEGPSLGTQEAPGEPGGAEITEVPGPPEEWQLSRRPWAGSATGSSPPRQARCLLSRLRKCLLVPLQRDGCLEAVLGALFLGLSLGNGRGQPGTHLPVYCEESPSSPQSLGVS